MAAKTPGAGSSQKHRPRSETRPRTRSTREGPPSRAPPGSGRRPTGQPVPEPAQLAEIARVVPLVDHAHTREQSSGRQAVVEHLDRRAGQTGGVDANIPSTTKPMWLTELYATNRLMSVCASAAKAP